MKRMVPLVCLLFAIHPVAADKPLAETAAGLAGKVPAGGIVTGERIGEADSFSELGSLEPAGVPAERRIFEIGSISKVFTGILLAEAVREEQVRLDTTLRDLLGERIAFKDPKVGDITLLQLATHTSGLPRIPPNMGPDPDAEDNPYASYDRKLLHEYLAAAELKGVAPFPAAYSNLGMGLLGDLLAGLNDKTWEALVKEKITGPLGMRDTAVTLGEEQLTRLAPPNRGDKAHHPWTFRSLAGAGALRSTAADLLIFGQALLDPGDSPLGEAIRSALEPRAPYNDFGAEIGLGMIIGKLDGEKVYEHSGGTGGYRSMLQVLPAARTVKVVLINNDAIPAEAILAATREERLVPAEAMKLTAGELDPYTGIFVMGPSARFTVLRVGDELRVRLTGQPFMTVEATGPDRFRYNAVAAEIQFAREGSNIVSLTLLQNGREIPAKRSADELPVVLFPTEKELAAYAGEFELAAEKVITITVRARTLFAQITGQAAYPVFSDKPDHFAYDIVEAAIEFQRRDKDGPVTGLILHQNGSHPAPKRP